MGMRLGVPLAKCPICCSPVKRITNGRIQDVFTFTFDCMKRYQGQWHTENALLFPNYIFLEGKRRQPPVSEKD